MSRTTAGATDGKAYPLSQDMFRAKLRFEFSPTFDVTLGYGYIHTDDHGLYGGVTTGGQQGQFRAFGDA